MVVRHRSVVRAQRSRAARSAAWIVPSLSAALALTAARTAAATPEPPVDIVRPGIYLSQSVEMRLQPDGTYELLELGGSRRAQGRYEASPGTLTFSSGAGDVGKTRFPLTCKLAGTTTGFAMRAGQSQCRPFDGLAFRSAN